MTYDEIELTTILKIQSSRPVCIEKIYEANVPSDRKKLRKGKFESIEEFL